MAVLQSEQEAAIATVEAMVYESAELSCEILLDPTLSSVRQRTNEYVRSCTLPGTNEQLAGQQSSMNKAFPWHLLPTSHNISILNHFQHSQSTL